MRSRSRSVAARPSRRPPVLQLSSARWMPFKAACQRDSPVEPMNEPATEQKRRPRILSGMRPTGRLHLGNLVGALANWVELQNHYESYHCVVDWHMLTTDYA